MADFHAWAVTGQVNKLQVWSEPADRRGTGAWADDGPSMRIASEMAVQQRFQLRMRDGKERQVHLVDSGMALQDGHVVTLVWAARAGATHGHCVYMENHTSGATQRLAANLDLVRTQVQTGKIVMYGALATVPAALALLAWLVIPGSFTGVEVPVLMLGGGIALVVLFTIGAIVARLVTVYLKSEDEEKIWTAVKRAITIEQAPQPATVSRLHRRA